MRGWSPCSGRSPMPPGGCGRGGQPPSPRLDPRAARVAHARPLGLRPRREAGRGGGGLPGKFLGGVAARRLGRAVGVGETLLGKSKWRKGKKKRGEARRRSKCYPENDYPERRLSGRPPRECVLHPGFTVLIPRDDHVPPDRCSHPGKTVYHAGAVRLRAVTSLDELARVAVDSLAERRIILISSQIYSQTLISVPIPVSTAPPPSHTARVPAGATRGPGRTHGGRGTLVPILGKARPGPPARQPGQAATPSWGRIWTTRGSLPGRLATTTTFSGAIGKSEAVPEYFFLWEKNPPGGPSSHRGKSCFGSWYPILGRTRTFAKMSPGARIAPPGEVPCPPGGREVPTRDRVRQPEE